MRVLLLALAATCSVVSLTAQQRAISDSDLFAFRWVASPQISPDGRQAAYVLVTVNAKHDGYETSLWLVNTDGASPPRRPAAALAPAAVGRRGAAADRPAQGCGAGGVVARREDDRLHEHHHRGRPCEEGEGQRRGEVEERRADRHRGRVPGRRRGICRPDGARPYLDGGGRHARRRAGEGTPGDVRRVRRERTAVEPRRDADLFRLGPRARVVLLPARQ